MDFWASLEHQLKYKTEGDVPDSNCGGTEGLFGCDRQYGSEDAEDLQYIEDERRQKTSTVLHNGFTVKIDRYPISFFKK